MNDTVNPNDDTIPAVDTPIEPKDEVAEENDNAADSVPPDEAA